MLIDGLREGKLTFPALRDYLDEYSWIDQPLTETDFEGKPVQYTWQPVLYPGLEEFFKQLQLAALQDPASSPSFVMCLDSLTPKVEGLLRELLQLTGATTLASNKKNDLREVYLDDLLDMVQQNQLLTESEVYYIRFVLTPVNHNLRNNIAHSYYYLPEHYSLENMVLVFCALLRLIGFSLTEKPAQD